MMGVWGVPEEDAGWCTFMARKYDEMSYKPEKYNINAAEDEYSPGVVRRKLYLQCGAREAGEPRFYASLDEWLEHNKPNEEMKPLGPVIHT